MAIDISSEKNDLRGSFDKKIIQDKLSEITKQNAAITQIKPEFVGLSAYIDQCWEAARQAKHDVQQELYESTLQRRGEYTKSKLAEIQKFKASTIFMNLTAVKCRAAEAWVRDALSPTGTEIWDIKPTPIPDLPPHLTEFINQLVYSESVSNALIMQGIEDPKELSDYLISNTQTELEAQAKTACDRMRLKISDQLKEAKWKKVLNEVISDIITCKAGFLKGPLVRRKPKLQWKQDEQSGTWSAVTEEILIVEYDRVDPFDIYPSPASTTVDDGFIIEHHRMTRKDLNALIDVPGYDKESIKLVLQRYGEGGLKDWIWGEELKDEAKGIESQHVKPSPEKTIDALEFWGSCQGKMLLDWGMTDDVIDDPDKEYHVNAWKIGNYIIKAIVNPDPIGKKPYHKASFEDISGMFHINIVL